MPRPLTDREFFCFNDVRGAIGTQVVSRNLSYRRSDDGGMVEMIVSRSRFVGVFILLCLGTLALFSSATFAQVFPGDNPSGVGNSSSSLTDGLLVPFRFKSGSNNGGPSLGILSASYDYNKFNYAEGVSFSDFRLHYSIPLRISGDGAAVIPFVRAYITNIKQTPETFGFLQDQVGFGGKFLAALSHEFFVVVMAEYDASRREGSWYSGGKAGVSLYKFVDRFNLVNLKAKYYAQSAGDMVVLPNGLTGYEFAVGYSFRPYSYNAWPSISGSWYSFNAGSGQEQRGWMLSASLPLVYELAQLRCSAGYDNVILGNYSIGADLNIPF